MNDLFETLGRRAVKFLSLDDYLLTRERDLGNNKIFELKISLSSNMYLQERRSVTILAWLSDIGGLNDAFVMILAPLITLISSNSFTLSL